MIYLGLVLVLFAELASAQVIKSNTPEVEETRIVVESEIGRFTTILPNQELSIDSIYYSTDSVRFDKGQAAYMSVLYSEITKNAKNVIEKSLYINALDSIVDSTNYAVSRIGEYKVLIGPNPFKSNTSLTVVDKSTMQGYGKIFVYTIYDSHGRIVFGPREALSNTQKEIGYAFQKGVNFLAIEYENQLSTFKVIKQQ
ncbi:MAG: T9SS type A sorting domain-containing protein [Flavobacteriales bacterium]|nr:T9SS type A sorting domain-containing protein [Flavobacteriales bacterium]